MPIHHVNSSTPNSHTGISRISLRRLYDICRLYFTALEFIYREIDETYGNAQRPAGCRGFDVRPVAACSRASFGRDVRFRENPYVERQRQGISMDESALLDPTPRVGRWRRVGMERGDGGTRHPVAPGMAQINSQTRRYGERAGASAQDWRERRRVRLGHSGGRADADRPPHASCAAARRRGERAGAGAAMKALALKITLICAAVLALGVSARLEGAANTPERLQAFAKLPDWSGVWRLNGSPAL